MAWMRNPLIEGLSVTRYRAKRPGSSVKASRATKAGGAEPTKAREAVARDRMSFIVGKVEVSCGFG